MTEYEAAALALQVAEGIRGQTELVQTQADLLSGAVATFFTILTGYLAVAYFVGPKLTQPQAVVLSGIYLLFAGVSLLSMFTAHDVGLLHYERLLKIDPSRAPAPFWSQANQMFSGVVLFFALAASLWFMRSVRRSAKR